MSEEPIGVGILGAGNIAGPYAFDLALYPNVRTAGVFDLDQDRATEFARTHGLTRFESLEEMLESSEVRVVANLSAHHAHYELTRRCLDAGKHVHSEKPLALTAEQAWELVELAKSKGLRLGCSPFSWLGNASQAMRSVLQEGRIGAPKLVYAEVNWGFIEAWHPSPASFHKVGALWDVGVYPLALATAFFGPARRVHSIGRSLKADRFALDGTPFELDAPDWTVCVIDFESGVTMRLTANFYVDRSRQRATLEVHGDEGTVRLADWLNFDSDVEFSLRKGEWEDIEYPKCGSYVRWGLAVADLSAAIHEGRSPLASGEHAAHLVDILEACERSRAESRPVDVHSSFPSPSHGGAVQ